VDRLNIYHLLGGCSEKEEETGGQITYPGEGYLISMGEAARELLRGRDFKRPREKR